MDFTGKVVLITGASSGIGADTAVYLSSLGAKVSLTGRNEERLKKTVQKCKEVSKGSEPFFVIGDLSKEEDVKNVFNKTIEKYGGLNILINNAAGGGEGSLETVIIEEYDSELNLDVRSVLLLTKLAMPYLIESKGNVVNISSVASFRPYLNLLPHCMAKAALDQFTKCVALEVTPKQVRVNSVNPGGVKTEGMDTLDKDALEELTKQHPIGRIASPREIATTIAFLASDLASNVTGAVVVVDGGLSLS